MTDETVDQMKAALQKAQEDLRRAQSKSQQTINNLKKELESVKSNKAPKPRGHGMTLRNLNLTDSSSREDEEKELNTRSDLEEEETDPAAKKLTLLESQNKKIHRMLAKLPGAPMPVAEESSNAYAQSPFVDGITKALIPKKINVYQPHKLYDGSTDPYNHVAQYKQKM